VKSNVRPSTSSIWSAYADTDTDTNEQDD
jgi:hypothetical protein